MAWEVTFPSRLLLLLKDCILIQLALFSANVHLRPKD